MSEEGQKTNIEKEIEQKYDLISQGLLYDNRIFNKLLCNPAYRHNVYNFLKIGDLNSINYIINEDGTEIIIGRNTVGKNGEMINKLELLEISVKENNDELTDKKDKSKDKKNGKKKKDKEIEIIINKHIGTFEKEGQTIVFKITTENAVYDNMGFCFKYAKYEDKIQEKVITGKENEEREYMSWHANDLLSPDRDLNDQQLSYIPIFENYTSIEDVKLPQNYSDPIIFIYERSKKNPGKVTVKSNIKIGEKNYTGKNNKNSTSYFGFETNINPDEIKRGTSNWVKEVDERKNLMLTHVKLGQIYKEQKMEIPSMREIFAQLIKKITEPKDR